MECSIIDDIKQYLKIEIFSVHLTNETDLYYSLYS